jgi:nicotinate-nucleotide pyrophosphorylase (carboxylating)
MHVPDNPPRFDWDAAGIAALIRAAFEEDIGPRDLTAESVVAADLSARARVVAKQELVLAGLPLFERMFRQLDPQFQAEPCAAEGAAIRSGEIVVRLHGNARALLSGERTALNFLAHLCGIATLTRRYVEAISGTQARIRDTRKTTPLLRALEKYAVRVGGGTNHRFGLFDAILIKENHIALAGSVENAMRLARRFVAAFVQDSREMTAYESFNPPTAAISPVVIQIEVRNEEELRQAVAAGADSVLVDNVSPAEAARLVRISREQRSGCVVEISGGVSLDTVRAYAKAGVDFISVGALTHSAPAADLSLLVEPPGNE